MNKLVRFVFAYSITREVERVACIAFEFYVAEVEREAIVCQVFQLCVLVRQNGFSWTYSLSKWDLTRPEQNRSLVRIVEA